MNLNLCIKINSLIFVPTKTKKNMLNLLTKTIETVSRSISYAVDVEFEKDGVKHEAHVICILNEETNIGFHDWDCFIENEDDFHELTLDEENQILEHAKKYAQTLAG